MVARGTPLGLHPDLLRFQQVDNLGAYSIPSETGLLVPSGYVNCHATIVGVMQGKAAQTSGGLPFVATECMRADAYFMLLSFDNSLTVALSS
jgi:hypothetical protein